MAGCAGFPAASKAPVRFSALDSAALQSTVFRPDATGDFRRVGDDDRGRPGEGLVGMWTVTFTSDGSAYPVPIDAGIVTDLATIQFHSDGTEFQISGARAPSTGDVCMGVWKHIGERTYKVNHLALAWASPDGVPPAPAAAFLGPAAIRERIHVSPGGNSFEGTFTIDQMAKDGVTLIEHIGGTMTGKRFTVD